MKLTVGQKLICERAINAFETSSINGKYHAFVVMNDGPSKIEQITYGRSQTTEYGNLRLLIEMYAKAKGKYSDALRPFVPMIGRTALTYNQAFIDLLKKAGKEDPVMAAVQDTFFDERYFLPAQKWAAANGFTLPLSMLVIYDSYIQSGSILDKLRSRFREMPPKAGGDEKAWITAYVKARHAWLSTHSNHLLVNSSYRTQDLLREIDRGNWMFQHLPLIAHGLPVDDQSPPPKVKLGERPVSKPEDLVPFFGTMDDTPPPATKTDTPPVVQTNTGGDRIATLRTLAAAVNMKTPVEKLITYRNAHRPNSNPRYWAAVDFGMHSAKPRLFLFDCVAGKVTRHLCAHGRGSDPDHNGIADHFSNKDGSNCTSLGIYVCDVTYQGGNGLSLYLDGMESSNSAARHRHIVMHGADYVSPAFVDQHHKIGRSHGCPAIDLAEVEAIIPKLAGGSLLIHWKA